MPETRLRELLPEARELALLFAARGLACVAAWRSGFRALSDDDYARISIAQRFAREPHFDASGTSWLPAPFWAYGAAFRAFGTGLGVARTVAIVLALAATVLVYVAARALGTNRNAALVAAVLSCVLVPYSTLLGVAALPEVPCAALSLFAAATLTAGDLRLRAGGAAALLFACLSRYEAWPIAAAFAAFCVWDSLRQRRFGYLACAALSLTGPLLWLVLGHSNHGDAWFFVARVTAYRRALGVTDVPLWRRLLEYPQALIWNALALSVLFPVFLITAPKTRSPDAPSYARCVAVLLAMLAFLMLGSVRDGVPTHHAARVLLPLWFFGCIVAGREFTRRATDSGGRWRVAVVVVAIAAIPLLHGVPLPSNEGFAQRALELEAGVAARKETEFGLAIDTADYGYFAVQAGFGSPVGTSVLDDHDPRRPKHPSVSPFASARALEHTLDQHGARFALLTSAHAPLLAPRCQRLWENAGFVLFRCPEPASVTG
ncbi:MAG TPA: hypothetical protein VER12_04020 [Polyangiaceae bacterium]|nr:hypothetical protein [Polyangiaceae bacterium]